MASRRMVVLGVLRREAFSPSLYRARIAGRAFSRFWRYLHASAPSFGVLPPGDGSLTRSGGIAATLART